MDRRADTVLCLYVLVLGLLRGCQGAVSLICLFVYKLVHRYIYVFGNDQFHFYVSFLSFKNNVGNEERVLS